MQLARLFLLLVSLNFFATRMLTAAEPRSLVIRQIELTSKQTGNWRIWEGLGDVQGLVSHRERITAVAASHNDLWIGTSRGRLLTQADNVWILQGTLKGLQITGIAVSSTDQVWLSTSDGMRRLDRDEDKSWKITEFLSYYEGHPSFVERRVYPG